MSGPLRRGLTAPVHPSASGRGILERRVEAVTIPVVKRAADSTVTARRAATVPSFDSLAPGAPVPWAAPALPPTDGTVRSSPSTVASPAGPASRRGPHGFGR